jgi:DNA polymerase (family 10)
VLKNSQVSELLAREAEKFKPPLSRAFKRASRAALLWTEEVGSLIISQRSLTELASVGPFLERIIKGWCAAPRKLGLPAPIRRNFIFKTEADALLRKNPDWLELVCGDLQMHTEWSDGSGTIRSMAEEADRRGYQYIGITDHAKGLRIAGGINEEELRKQGEEISEVNAELKSRKSALRVLRSIELNLSVNGEGDMDAKALQKLDIVLGAFHSALRRTEDQTARYIAALKQPYLNILGHPRTRIYNYRLGLQADWERIFETAVKYDKAVEIDCYPDRQDLDVDRLKLARKAGVKISLGTDAHHPWQLEAITLGLAAALKARIPKERILNFMTRDGLLAWARQRR